MVILNEAKPKYERLNEILEDDLQNIRYSTQVNIIVDVKEIIRKFHRPDILFSLESHRELIVEISSDILNIIGHYRNYFYKKGKYTTFYFLYSYSECEEMKKLFPNYKKEYYEKYFNWSDEKCLISKKAIEVVEKVINVIPHASFINTSNYDEFVYAKYLREIIPDNELIYILSNDSIFFQLIDAHTRIINIKGINSELLSEKSAMRIISKKEDIKISPKLLPLALAISGEKKYSLDKVPHCALMKALNIIEKLFERGIVKDQELIEVPLDFSKLDPKNKLDMLILKNADLIENNYYLIKADRVLVANKTEISRKFITDKAIRTIEYFKQLNSKIFSMFPLNIEMIIKGEKI